MFTLSKIFHEPYALIHYHVKRVEKAAYIYFIFGPFGAIGSDTKNETITIFVLETFLKALLRQTFNL